MTISKYSLGCGDRFAHAARAQLAAYEKAAEIGLDVTPVWNKSNREHLIVGTRPVSVLDAAREAVDLAGWKKSWHVDADHITIKTVDEYLNCSDFFTMDLADAIGGPVDNGDVDAFLKKHADLVGRPVPVKGLAEPLRIDADRARAVVKTYLPAIRSAGTIYRRILSARGEGNFIPEVSTDEADVPQRPEELLFILAALADEGIPVQTLAPKFSGRFNKGVDYVGDPEKFASEFEADILVIRYAIESFGLPSSLKLSVHTGSDKFSIYPKMNKIMKKLDCGVHLKTAGTTWLEEIIGLAEAGGKGLEMAKEVYSKSWAMKEELCAPYTAVIDIDYKRLPAVEQVMDWTAEEYVRTLRHDDSDPMYNPDFRQLIHVGFKVAAKMGDSYLHALADHADSVARNVTYNLFERHLKPLFL